MTERSTSSHCSRVTRARVKVSGPGGTFGDVVLGIKEGLESFGAIVTVEDNDPPTATVESLREMLKRQHVTIEVSHLPWGG